MTKASNSEVKETEKHLKNIKKEHLRKLERCDYFLADRGYDSTELIQWLTTEGIAPIIALYVIFGRVTR